jgi:hypothetical protein
VTLGLLIITVVLNGAYLPRVLSGLLHKLYSSHLEALIINLLIRNRWAFCGMPAKSAISLSFLVRAIVFSIYHIVVAVYAGFIPISRGMLLKLCIISHFPSGFEMIIAQIKSWCSQRVWIGIKVVTAFQRRDGKH